MVVIRTRFLGFRNEDPSAEELAEAGPGSWWFRSDLKQWKWYDGNEIKILPITVKSFTTADITMPLAGGIVTTSIDAASFGLTKIQEIIDLRIKREAPVIAAVYEPSYGINETGDAIGVTLATGTGTTLKVEATVLGY